jgi:hypothetical protein
VLAVDPEPLAAHEASNEVDLLPEEAVLLHLPDQQLNMTLIEIPIGLKGLDVIQDRVREGVVERDLILAHETKSFTERPYLIGLDGFY